MIATNYVPTPSPLRPYISNLQQPHGARAEGRGAVWCHGEPGGGALLRGRRGISDVSCGVQITLTRIEVAPSSRDLNNRHLIEQLSMASLPYLKLVGVGQQDRFHDLS